MTSNCYKIMNNYHFCHISQVCLTNSSPCRLPPWRVCSSRSKSCCGRCWTWSHTGITRGEKQYEAWSFFYSLKQFYILEKKLQRLIKLINCLNPTEQVMKIKPIKIEIISISQRRTFFKFLIMAISPYILINENLVVNIK